MDSRLEAILTVQDLLEIKGWSQRELARRTGIRQATINKMCNNEAVSLPLENIAKVCEVLQCTPNDFIKIVTRK